MKKLFEIYHINKDKLSYIFEKFSLYEDEIEKFKNCYIFIDTNFVRNCQPIFVLAVFENKRQIELKSRDLVFKSQKQIEQYISNIVKSHY